MSKTNNAGNWVWIDLEMTGLDPDHDRIIEMAIIVTDSQLNVLAEAPVVAVHQSDDVLSGMDEWNTNTHTKSGLVERVRKSVIDETKAEEMMLAFLADFVQVRESPMCGNSICQDRRFLYRYMPKLEAYFHYRNLDVSTIKELARRWSPNLYDGFQKKGTHQALDDIRESIAELQFYREHFLKLN
jgi:oligoribonuclease